VVGGGDVAHVGGREILRFCKENLKERDRLEALGVDGRIMV